MHSSQTANILAVAGLDQCPQSSTDDKDHFLAIVIAASIGGALIIVGAVYLLNSRQKHGNYETIG